MHLPNSEFISVGTTVVSLLISATATWIARSSLLEARLVAGRELKDWRQRKWFDLYFKADEVYDGLASYQARYGIAPVADRDIEENHEWNKLLDKFAEVHRIASVFPIDPTITALLLATTGFNSREEAIAPGSLKRISDAVEGVRQKALVDPGVLSLS